MKIVVHDFDNGPQAAHGHTVRGNIQTRLGKLDSGEFSALILAAAGMRRLDLYDTVDGAVCVMDSLNHLTRTAELDAVFARLSLFIAPGGLFVFDVNTPYKHREVLGDSDYILEEDGLLCLWRNRLTPRTCTVEIWLDMLEEGPDGRYRRETEIIRERAYSLNMWHKVAKRAGFEPLAVYADMTEEKPAADCQRWVLVVRNSRIK